MLKILLSRLKSLGKTDEQMLAYLEMRDSSGLSAIHHAALSSLETGVSSLIKLLLQTGATLDIVDSFGRTAYDVW